MDENEEEDSEQEENENPEDTGETEELSYEQKLEKWFAEIEAKDGVEVANQYRKKIAAERELKHWADSEKWLEYFRELQVKQIDKAIMFDVELTQRCREYMKKSQERLEKFMADSDARDELLNKKVLELLARSEERDRKYDERLNADLDEDEKRDSAWEKKTSELAALKKRLYETQLKKVS
ncbi:MAG: hypothetical protein ABSB89_08575 [Candidatus Bathyarchaeia archaeon]|jgi:hypothetical protein